MPRVFITHDVVDVETWLHGKAERAEAIGTMGGGNVVDHVAHDGSNKIAVSVDTDDVGALMAAVAAPTPELAAKMQEHGVIPPLTAYVER